jgi:hypothetical protein
MNGPLRTDTSALVCNEEIASHVTLTAKEIN